MKYEHLPVYRDAMKMSVYVENMVRSFEKYHKYTIGIDLRKCSKDILFNISFIFLEHKKDFRISEIYRLRNKCEEMKILVNIAKELKSYRTFKQYEFLSKMAVDISKQVQSWYNKTAGVPK